MMCLVALDPGIIEGACWLSGYLMFGSSAYSIGDGLLVLTEGDLSHFVSTWFSVMCAWLGQSFRALTGI